MPPVGSRGRLFLGLVAIFVVILVSYVLMALVYQPIALPTAIAVSVCIIVFLMSRWQTKPPVYDRELRQLHALVSLSPLLGDTFLPFGSMAMEPDAVLGILDHARSNHCDTIVECGSGISTLLIGRLLKQAGHGRIYSLEQDADWHRLMTQLVQRAGLDDQVVLLHAPLELPLDDAGQDGWYNRSVVEGLIGRVETIDLLIVDGPRSVSEHSRYPALGAFWPRLTEDSLVILDDANRPFERALLERWTHEFPLEVQPVSPSGRGQAYIRIRCGERPPVVR